MIAWLNLEAAVTVGSIVVIVGSARVLVHEHRAERARRADEFLDRGRTKWAQR